MKKLLRLYLLLYVLLALIACSSSKSITENSDRSLANFADHLLGNFSSKLQSEQDTAFYHVTLSTIRIWEDRTDGIWLYVEQAMATAMDRPYRQRVYHLRRGKDKIFTSDIYLIDGEKGFAGLTRQPQKMAALTYDKISLKEACTVYLTQNAEGYKGATEGKKCPSDLRGASYTTTEISLERDKMISWDRGFDAEDNQVWGATKGGYVFLRQ